MSEYHKIIYPDTENDYPEKFANYLCKRFFRGIHKKILDVGCGKGVLDHFIRVTGGHDIYGIDKRIESNYAIDFNELKECDLEKEKFPYPINAFDYVFSKSVLEHIYNPENMIKEMYRVLKPNGTIVLMTPDWTSQQFHFWDDYTHVHAWTLKSLTNCLRIFEYRNVDGELFYQLPFVWNRPYLKVIPKIVSICPQSWKWKDKSMSNGKDRKLIRFSKEKMLLTWATK